VLAANVQAEITNPVIGTLGDDSEKANTGAISTRYFVVIWRAIIFVGGLSVLLYLVWGAVEWISAGGDSGKIQKARDKMTQGVVGMIVLVGTFVIAQLISELFFDGQFDLLKLSIESLI
jgi:hypothetical protein